LHNGVIHLDEARDFAEASFLNKSHKGIIGVGITNPIKSVLVYAEDRLAASEVPSHIGNIPVKVKIIGKVYTADPYLADSGGDVGSPTPEHILKYRPLLGGISIGHTGNSGTLGALVFKNGVPCILTNNHVALRSQTVASDIMQPGAVDDGVMAEDKVGRTNWWTVVGPELENEVDAALVRLDSGILFTKEILDIGRYSDVIDDPRIGMSVQKSGRTTGYATGKIEALNVSMRVNDSRFLDDQGNERPLLYKGLASMTPGSMIKSGDSGSVIWSRPTTGLPRPVALAFASSNTTAFAAPIRKVAAKLAFSFSGGDSTAPSGSIYYPIEGQKLFPSRFKIRGTARDSAGIQIVLVRVDSGAMVFARSVTGQFAVWEREFTIGSIGPHRITAKIVDNRGNIRFVTRNITIQSGTGGGGDVNPEPPENPPPAGGSAGLALAGVMFAGVLGGALWKFGRGK
jgi:hypothetical protein